MGIKSILFIDIPEMEELDDSSIREIIQAKWKTEDLILGEAYAAHMGALKYSRGLLTVAEQARKQGVETYYMTIDDMYENETDFEELVSRVEAVGIEANVTAFQPYVEQVARRIKEIKDNSLIIVGGSHVSFTDVDTLKQCREVDIVIRGEGEGPINELIIGYPYLNRIKGITYRDDMGKIVRMPDAPFLSPEEVPLPAYGLLDKPLGKYSLRVQGSRGCVFTCSFCEDHVFWGHTRFFPLENVVRELDFLSQNIERGTHIHFIDSILTLNPTRTRLLLRTMSARGYDLSFSGDIRARLVKEDIVELLQDAGFKVLLIGLEDPDQMVLDSVHKQTRFEQNLDTIDRIKQNSDIKVAAYWIVGLPGSTHESLHKAVKTSRELIRTGRVDVVYSGIFVPVPGTPIFEYPDEFGVRILTKDWGKYLRAGLTPIYELSDLSAEEIYNYHLLFETSNLIEYCQKLGVDINDLKLLIKSSK